VARAKGKLERFCGNCRALNVLSRTGGKNGAKAKKCTYCDGNGWQANNRPVGNGLFAVSREACSHCDGEGETMRDKDRCKKCKGTKTVKEKTRQEIHVEKGMTNGQRIVLHGAGDQEVRLHHALPSIGTDAETAGRAAWRCDIRTEDGPPRYFRTLGRRLAYKSEDHPLRGVVRLDGVYLALSHILAGP
jgi:hypothetical protein